MNIKQAAKELAKEIKSATAVRDELNPNVIKEDGWQNFLGSVESNLVKVLPVIIKYIKATPDLLAPEPAPVDNKELKKLGEYLKGVKSREDYIQRNEK